MRPSISILLTAALALAAGSQAGELVSLDPQGVTEPKARDEAALENAFYEAYGRRFPGYAAAKSDPASLEGAFVTFQKGLILLSAQGDALREQMEESFRDRPGAGWFDPDFPPSHLRQPDGNRLLPSGYQITDETSDRDPPQLYAPDTRTLEELARLAERARTVRTARESERLQRDFLDLMRLEVTRLQAVAGGREVTGLGVAERDGRLGPITLDPDTLRAGIQQAVAGPGPGAPTPTAAGEGAPRTATAATRAYFSSLRAQLDDPMTASERDAFLMEHDGGFHLRSGASYLEGDLPDPERGERPVMSDLYLAHPLDVMSGAFNLDSRRTR